MSACSACCACPEQRLSWEAFCNAADRPSADSQWETQLSCCFWAAVLLFCNASADRVPLDLNGEFMTCTMWVTLRLDCPPFDECTLGWALVRYEQVWGRNSFRRYMKQQQTLALWSLCMADPDSAWLACWQGLLALISMPPLRPLVQPENLLLIAPMEREGAKTLARSQ